MTLYQREQLRDLWEEVIPLLVQHWQEIAHYKDIKLDPDIETYTRMEESGHVRVFTARTDEGELIGYLCYFVRNNGHYRGSLQAVQDVLYLHPRHRRGFTGPKLIKFADSCLAAEGVQVVYQHIKAAKDFGVLLERMGYELVDKIYARRLDHGSNSRDRDRGSDSRGSKCEGDVWQDTGPASYSRHRIAARGPVARSYEEGETEASAPVGNDPHYAARAG